MLLNYADLVWVNLDSSASYHVTKELLVSHPEHAFSHIEAQFVVLQYLKHLSQIQYVLFKLLSLDYHSSIYTSTILPIYSLNICVTIRW